MIGVGTKVICVDANKRLRTDGKPSFNEEINGPLVKGEIYVVDGFAVDDLGRLGFLILGKPCVSTRSGRIMGWNADRFRELEYEQMRSELEYIRHLPLEVHP